MNIPIDFPLAGYLDQTVLRPGATAREVQAAAVRAGELGFAALCVAPCRVAEAAEVLHGAAVVVQTVIGFPLGFQSGSTKCFEAEEAVRLGAGELDLVGNRGLIRDGNWGAWRRELIAVASAAGPVSLKVILEISDLTSGEILEACRQAKAAGVSFVKTSTGFFGTGADVAVVRSIRENFGPGLKIKASGGIRTLAEAWRFIEAGADRIGTSSGVEILAGMKSAASA